MAGFEDGNELCLRSDSSIGEQNPKELCERVDVEVLYCVEFLLLELLLLLFLVEEVLHVDFVVELHEVVDKIAKVISHIVDELIEHSVTFYNAGKERCYLERSFNVPV